MSTRLTNGIKRSAAGNLSRRRATSFTIDRGATITGTGIAFTSPGTITDSGNQLAVQRLGQTIEVIGSPLNSRSYVVQTTAAGTLTVTPAVIQSEVAGATISIRGVD
jgi:hypothetical protein